MVRDGVEIARGGVEIARDRAEMARDGVELVRGASPLTEALAEAAGGALPAGYHPRGMRREASGLGSPRLEAQRQALRSMLPPEARGDLAAGDAAEGDLAAGDRAEMAAEISAGISDELDGGGGRRPPPLVRLQLRVGAESGGWMSPQAPRQGVLTSHTLPTLKGPSEALAEEGEHAIVHGGAMIAQLASVVPRRFGDTGGAWHLLFWSVAWFGLG